ncbi:MAG: carbohydrate kinase [Bacteroidales bacterium]|nr:carbohydrate kinase [Bacteroidales bacterium]
MAKEKWVVGIGEALWDLLPDGAKIGGAPANFAYHAGQFGLKALAISALGDDALGDETEKVLREKLDIYMERVPFPTGTVNVTLDGKGVPQYEIREDVAWDNIPLTERLTDIARESVAVCFGSLAQRNPVSRAAIRAFLAAMPEDAMKIFDINLRQHFYGREVVENSLELCNILKINDEELAIVARMFEIDDLPSDEQCRRIRACFDLDMVILTCGTAGSHVFADGVESHFPTPEVAVADTVGAGDAFTGAFCAALLQGMPIGRAHERAVRVSAYVCTQSGAMPPLPPELAR